jgi:membrane-associated phospholipid phosphatase
MKKTTIIERAVTGFFIFLYFQLGYVWSSTDVSARAYDLSFFIDTLIPIVPVFIIFYLIGYFFVFSFLFIKVDRDVFRLAVIHYVGILTISFLIFKIFPVYMDKDLALGSDIFSRLTYSQQTLDSPYNNFPSLHVSLNLFTFFLLLGNLNDYLKKVYGLIAFLIIISTVLVKQHLFVDLIGGVLIGLIFVKLYRYLLPLPKPLIQKLWKASIITTTIFILSQHRNITWILKSLLSYSKAFF